MEIPLLTTDVGGPVSGTVALRNVFLHVTKACNLHCAYCYFSASRPLPDELTTEEFERLWPDLVALRPQKVVFTGGEPLLRPDILELLRALRDADPDHRVIRCLNSNGKPVTAELARELIDLVDEVRVSIDGLPARNDALRGAGSFRAALQALEHYYAAGFQPKVLVTVTSASLVDLEELLCLLIEHGFSHVNVNMFRPIGRGKGHPELMIQPAQMRAAVERAWNRCFPGQHPPADVSESCSNCGVGSFLNIMPNGDVFPCHVLVDREFRCGNIREQNLLDICNRTGLLGQLQALDFRELAHQDESIAELRERNACMGNIYAKSKAQPIWRDHLPLIMLKSST